MNGDPKTASRLENVCAMLSSPNDAERATAASMATRMLNELGLDWRAFTQRALAGAKVEQPQERDWQDASRELELYLKLLQWDGLTEWERGFVSSLYDRHPKPLTEKQSFYFWRIVQKFEASQHAF